MSSLNMASVCQLVLVTWLIHPHVSAITVTEFRPANCPTDCLCGVGTSMSPLSVKGYFATVSCPNRKLAEFPTRMPSATTIAVLRGNALKSTAGSALPPQLAELDLSYNVIDDVTMTSPAHLLMRHLDLQHNVIRRLSPSSFTGLPHLDVLLVGYNRITQLNASWFHPLAELRWLSLAGNRLTALASGQFRDVLPQLSHLDLSRNEIEDVAADAVSGLESLRELDLSHNRVSRLPRRSFVGVEALGRLDLSGNQLEDLPTNALKVFKSLNALIIDGNPLTSLASRRLTGFSARLISLSRMSRLRFVDLEAFFNVRRLTTITMHNNPRLAFISEHLVGPQTTSATIFDVQLHHNQLTVIGNLSRTLPALRKLTLYGNPLRCSCHNDWIQQTVLSNNTRLLVALSANSNDTARYHLPCAGVDQPPSSVNPDVVVRRHDAFSPLASSTIVSGQNATFSTGDVDPTLSNTVRPAYQAAEPGSIKQQTDTSNMATTGSWNTPETEMENSSSSSSCGGAAVILLSDVVYYVAAGSSIAYDCRAVGTSGIQWILPGRKVVSKTPNHSRLRLSEAGSLFIDHVKSTDAGRYQCCATSGSTDDVMTQLVVFNATAKLVLQTVGSDFVSVTWKGLGSTIASTQYAVLYRERQEYHLRPSPSSDFTHGRDDTKGHQLDQNPVTTEGFSPRDLCTAPTGNRFPPSCFRQVDVRQYMRSYWVGGLSSDQTYQFCVGYVRQTDGWVVPLDCGSVRTLSTRGRYDPRHHVPTMVSVFVVVLITAPCAFCIFTAFVRRYRHRKQYNEPPHASRRVRRQVDKLCPSRQSEAGEVGDITCRVDVTDGGRAELSRRYRTLERTLLRGEDDATISPIPLNCLYDLPSTSLSTTNSQTSLIGHA